MYCLSQYIDNFIYTSSSHFPKDKVNRMHSRHTWLILLVGVLSNMNVSALPVDTSLTEVESTKVELAESSAAGGSMGDGLMDPSETDGLPVFPTHRGL
jgi:hypothetical protein